MEQLFDKLFNILFWTVIFILAIPFLLVHEASHALMVIAFRGELDGWMMKFTPLGESPWDVGVAYYDDKVSKTGKCLIPLAPLFPAIACAHSARYFLSCSSDNMIMLGFYLVLGTLILLPSTHDFKLFYHKLTR